VLSLGTASAAVTTVNTDLLMSFSSGDADAFAFVPNGSSYVAEYNTSPSFPGRIRYCGLELRSNTPGIFQWTDTFLSEGAIVDASDTFQDELWMMSFPAEGTTVYAGYRYLSSYTGEDPNYTYGYVSVTGNAPPEGGGYNKFTLNSYTYESTENTGISIGAIPEPSAALLAFAGAGLFFRRRRAS